MSENLRTIDTLKVPDPAMFDQYDVGKWTPPPQAKAYDDTGKVRSITYTLTAPTADKMTIQPDRNGYAMLVVDGFTTGDYTFGKAYFSSAQFPKKNKAGEIIGYRNASGFGNYLRAFGLEVRPTTAAEYEALAFATAGLDCHATIDWEAYDSETKATVAATWEAFPEDPEHPGQRVPWVEQGERRYWARAVVKRLVDQVGA